MPCRFLVALLCLLPLAAAHAQDHACTDQLRQADNTLVAAARPVAANGVTPLISARQLAIPARAWQHYQRAVSAAAQQRPELAETEAARALALAPNFAEVYLLRALQAVHSGRPADALTLLATAHTLAPGLPFLNIAAAGALNQLHRFNQALGELASIPGAEAGSWQAMYERARAQAGLGHLSAALDTSQLAVVAAPVGCTEARLLRANLLRATGHTAAAITELETYLAEDRLKTRSSQVLAGLDRLRLETGADDDGGVAVVRAAAPPSAQAADSYSQPHSDSQSGLLAMQ